MNEVWDVLPPSDLNALDEAADRVIAEEFLGGRRPWPASGILPVKRMVGDQMELGYMRKVMAGPEADPVVYGQDGGPTRRYVSNAQVIESGWRID